MDGRVGVVMITRNRRVEVLMRGARWVLAERRPVPPTIEARLAALDGSQRRSTARRYIA